MSDLVVDSSVVAKWILPEADSPQAERLVDEVALRGERLLALDLALVEVANSIWKRLHQGLIDLKQAKVFLECLLDSPLHLKPAATLLPRALEIAAKYDRAVYDALFVALAAESGLRGVTADEPLVRAVSVDYPQIVLLREWPGTP